ncbi:hypothetical protein ACSSS7_001123 [Eimeria intestinalis]
MRPWYYLPLHSIPLLIVLLRCPPSSATAVEPYPGGAPPHFRPVLGGHGGVGNAKQETESIDPAAAFLVSPPSPPARRPVQEQVSWADVAATQGDSLEEMIEGNHEVQHQTPPPNTTTTTSSSNNSNNSNNNKKQKDFLEELKHYLWQGA